MPGRRPAHGATRRSRTRPTAGSFDVWLNRAVDVAVITALLVGATALAVVLL